MRNNISIAFLVLITLMAIVNGEQGRLERVMSSDVRMKMSYGINNKILVYFSNSHLELYSQEELLFDSDRKKTDRKSVKFHMVKDPTYVKCKSDNKACAIAGYEVVEFFFIREGAKVGNGIELDVGYFRHYEKNSKFPVFFYSVEFVGNTNWSLLGSREAYGVYRVDFSDMEMHNRYAPSYYPDKLTNLEIIKNSRVFCVAALKGHHGGMHIVDMTVMGSLRGFSLELSSGDKKTTRRISQIEAYPSKRYVVVASEDVHVYDYDKGEKVFSQNLAKTNLLFDLDVVDLLSIPQDSSILMLRLGQLDAIWFNIDGEIVEVVSIIDNVLDYGTNLFWSTSFKSPLIGVELGIFMPIIPPGVGNCHRNCQNGVSDHCKSLLSNAYDEDLIGCNSCKDGAMDSRTGTCYYNDLKKIDGSNLGPLRGFVHDYKHLEMKGNQIETVFHGHGSLDDLEKETYPEEDKEHYINELKHNQKKIKKRVQFMEMLAATIGSFTLTLLILVCFLFVKYNKTGKEEEVGTRKAELKKKPGEKKKDRSNLERSSVQQMTNQDMENQFGEGTIDLEFDNESAADNKAQKDPFSSKKGIIL